MKVTFLGDTHGYFTDLKRAWDNNPETDLFFQVGDFGIMPKADGGKDLRKLSKMARKGGKPTLFIDGNHEDHWLLADRIKRGNLNFGSAVYVPRSSQLRLGNSVVNCLGGAMSIDKHHRTVGKTWWPEETPNYEEVMRFADLSPADIIVTHTAPLSVAQSMGLLYGSKGSDPTSNDLDGILRVMDYAPKFWFFGHFHPTEVKTMEFNGTTFVCLPCVHAHESAKGYDGYTITL
jgi:hypothetical protein